MHILHKGVTEYIYPKSIDPRPVQHNEVSLSVYRSENVAICMHSQL